MSKIQLLGYQPVGVAFNPVYQDRVVATDGRDETQMAEADIEGMRQSRKLHVSLPEGYSQRAHSIVVSSDGIWAYMLLGKTWNAPPSKLLAVKIEPGDTTAPLTTMDSLAPTQADTWWPVSWSGTDDLSGVHHYDVQYRVGAAGRWHNWLLTSDTHALFLNATPGATYYFRVRAVDNAGNTEPYPADFDTATIAGGDPIGALQLFLPSVWR